MTVQFSQNLKTEMCSKQVGETDQNNQYDIYYYCTCFVGGRG